MFRSTLVFTCVAALAAAASAADDGKAKSPPPGPNAAAAAPAQPWRRYLVRTPAGTIEVLDAQDAPADPSAVEGDASGEVSWTDRSGIVHRSYTEEHLAKLGDTFGKDVEDLIRAGVRTSGRPGAKRALDLWRKLAIMGSDSEAAKDTVRGWVDHPTGARLDAALERGLVDNQIIPPGLAGTGRPLAELVELARDFAIVGGEDPAKNLSPGFVKDWDAMKRGNLAPDAFVDRWQGGGTSADDAGAPPDPAAADDNPQSPPGGGLDEGAGAGAGWRGGTGANDGAGNGSGEGAGPGAGAGAADGGVDVEPGANGGAGAQDGSGGQDAEGGEGGGVHVMVVSVEQNGDGSVTYTWTRSGGDDGQDGMYMTTYDDDGTFTVTDLQGNVVNEGSGTPPTDCEAGDTPTEDQATGLMTCGGGADDDEDADGADEGGDDADAGAGGSTECQPYPDDDGGHQPLLGGFPNLAEEDLARLHPAPPADEDDPCGTGTTLPATGGSTVDGIAVAQQQHQKLKDRLGNPTGVEGGIHGSAPNPGDLAGAGPHAGATDPNPNDDVAAPRGGGGVDPRGFQKKTGGAGSDDGVARHGGGASGAAGGSTSHARSDSAGDPKHERGARVNRVRDALERREDPARPGSPNAGAGAKHAHSGNARRTVPPATGTPTGSAGTPKGRAKPRFDGAPAAPKPQPAPTPGAVKTPRTKAGSTSDPAPAPRTRRMPEGRVAPKKPDAGLPAPRGKNPPRKHGGKKS